MSPSRLTDPKVFGSLVAIATAFSLAGCKKSDTRRRTPPARRSLPLETPRRRQLPRRRRSNHAQIAHIAVTANSVDSAAGQLAKKKGATKAVKGFAQTMVTDHGGVNKQAVALATKLNVTPEDNDTNKQLEAGGDANLAKLQSLSGAAFDKAYIDNEVAYHQAVLDALEKLSSPTRRTRSPGSPREGLSRHSGAPPAREDHSVGHDENRCLGTPPSRAIALLRLLGAIAACSRAAPRAHTVKIQNFVFMPAELTVARGDTVVWLEHRFRSTLDHRWQLGLGFEGDRGEWQLAVRGARCRRYDYYCVFHPT